MTCLKQSDFEIDEYHYIYKVTDTITGEYYIGMRSCNVEPEKDPYMGSGWWIRGLAKEVSGLDKVPRHAIARHFKNGKDRFAKEIIEVCGSRGEAFSREEYHVGDKWKLDEKCMNMTGGGDGFGVGDDHPNYDPTVYHLWNHYEGKEVFYTTNELRKLGIKYSALKSGKRIHEKGFSLYENRDKDIRIIFSDKKHHLWNHYEGKEVFYTTYELFKIGIEFSALKSGKYIHSKGISLYKNRNKDIQIKLSDKKHHLWNHYEGKEVFYTTYELSKIGIDFSVLKSGKRIHEKGISLYKNRDKDIRFIRSDEKHHLWNHYEGKEVFYTTNELSKIGIDFSTLKSGKYIHLKGISLYENRDKDIRIRMSDEKHHLWNHYEGKEVFYTTYELYKIGIAISQLKSGKNIHLKGISLYENRHATVKLRKPKVA